MVIMVIMVMVIMVMMVMVIMVMVMVFIVLSVVAVVIVAPCRPLLFPIIQVVRIMSIPRSSVITILGRVCGAVNEDALFLVQLLLARFGEITFEASFHRNLSAFLIFNGFTHS